ncbi:MAG: cell division protein FtsA [Verrucomicrobiales bacterium]|jgi:cell division protein FtsA
MKILGIGDVPSAGVRKGEIIDFELASTCVYNAIRTAEDKADLEIKAVYLSVTGSHITSLNHRGCVRIPEDQREITVDDVKELKKIAREVSIPETNAFLHTHIRHYFVDGQEGVEHPVGMCGTQLEADYHIIHGIRTRLQNAIRFVRELPMEVDDIVFSPLASAQIMLTRQEKDEGSLVIDIGGGTTDYVLYNNGSVCQSGCLAVGGDHINNDISMVLKVPHNLAEKLKVNYGSAIVDETSAKNSIVLTDETRFNGREIDLQELHEIIYMRLIEIFECVKKPLATWGHLDRVGSGIYLTGGTSLLPGIDRVAAEVFGDIPIVKSRPAPINGVNAVAEDPRYSTAIGLIRYAQLQEQELPQPSIIKRIGVFVRDLFGAPRPN